MDVSQELFYLVRIFAGKMVPKSHPGLHFDQGSLTVYFSQESFI